jgi:anthranilate synthase component 1
VKSDRSLAVERYSHVMHIVSNVEGDAAGRHERYGCASSHLPAGTSGAPKVHAME